MTGVEKNNTRIIPVLPRRVKVSRFFKVIALEHAAHFLYKRGPRRQCLYLTPWKKPQIKQPRMQYVNKTTWLPALAVLAALVWAWLGGSADRSQAPAAVNVTAAPVVRQDIPVTVPLVGNVVAYESVAVRSRLDSQITEVHFRDGGFVREGDVLFELDDRAVAAQISQFSAALEKEKANLVNAELQYNRARQLRKTQVVAQAQVDQARAMYEAQLAQVGAAQANLDNAQVQRSYARITAPISGRTGTINVTRGNTVRAGDAQALVTINRISPIRVQMAIPQRYYDAVKEALSAGGVRVTARNRDAAAPVQGMLEYLDNAIDISSGTFAARAAFANEDEKLWPGMFVNITLDLGILKNSLTIPSVAVQGDEGARFVYVLDERAVKAERRDVETGMNNGKIAVVTRGLAENDRVIVDGILRVTDGAPVAVTTPPPLPAAGAGAAPAPGRSP